MRVRLYRVDFSFSLLRGGSNLDPAKRHPPDDQGIALLYLPALDKLDIQALLQQPKLTCRTLLIQRAGGAWAEFASGVAQTSNALVNQVNDHLP